MRSKVPASRRISSGRKKEKKSIPTINRKKAFHDLQPARNFFAYDRYPSPATQHMVHNNMFLGVCSVDVSLLFHPAFYGLGHCIIFP